MLQMIVTIAAVFAAFSASSAEIPGGQVGKRVTGWDGAFSVSFVHVGQHSVTGLARVVNSDYDRPVDSISTAYFKYRWRNLDEVERSPWGGEVWHTVPMIKAGKDLLVTKREIVIPDFECDIEFFLTGTARVPYYNYVDYSGIGVGIGSHSEEVLGIEGHLKLPSGDVLGNCGREWFVRARCGESDVKEAVISK